MNKLVAGMLMFGLLYSPIRAEDMKLKTMRVFVTNTVNDKTYSSLYFGPKVDVKTKLKKTLSYIYSVYVGETVEFGKNLDFKFDKFSSDISDAVEKYYDTGKLGKLKICNHKDVSGWVDVYMTSEFRNNSFEYEFKIMNLGNFVYDKKTNSWIPK